MVGQKGQVKIIRDYLVSGNSITVHEAFSKFGIISLSSIIHDLREAGYVIKTTKIDNTGAVKYFM